MNARTALQYSAEPVGARQTARTLQVEVLKRLIEQHAVAGVGRGGHRWAALPQLVLLSEVNACLPSDLRIGLRTLRDLTREPGIVHLRALVDGKVTCFLRLGEIDSEHQAEQAVKILARMWVRKTGHVPSPRNYGHIRGLVEFFTPELAPAVLRCVLADWGRFMSGVKCDPGWTRPRFLLHPTLAVIVRFKHVAMDCYLTFVAEPRMVREEVCRMSPVP